MTDQGPGKASASKEGLSELLLENYRLDPGSIEYLVEEARRIGEDVPVEVATRSLKRPLSEEQRANVGEFVRRASFADESVARRFQHSARRMGRCPKGSRRWLLERARHGPPPIVERSELLVRAGATDLFLDDKDSKWSIDRLPELLDRIGRVDAGAHSVRIRLGSFTYASALAVLAEWILSNHLERRHEIECPPEMEAYLDRICFAAALRNREIRVSPDEEDWAVGLTRINRDLPTEEVTAKIVDIIDTFIHPEPQARQAFQTLIAEMIENVHRHAESTFDGFAVAQVYPKRLKMGITLVDSGIGVRQSFERGEPSIPIDTLRTDADFLRAACNLHATSKPARHSGYGLYLLSEVVARNRGTFSISSGSATLVGYLRRREVVFDSFSHAPWRGTIVSAIINLHNSLPILDVYRSMPAPEGYSADDLFVD